MEKPKFVTIIMTHFAMDPQRSSVMRQSVESLIANTKYPYELIVIDNGGSLNDSAWLLSKCEDGHINTYIRNSENMHFGYARNQGLRNAHGDYICIVDNDLMYEEGWLEKCVGVLDAFPDKNIYSTPLYYPTPGMNKRYHQGYLDWDGVECELNMRAGSNCFVVRQKDFQTIGWFLHHRIAGSRWTDSAVRAGYLACVVPGNLVKDAGLRQGYNLGEKLIIKHTIHNGEDVIINHD